MSRPTIKPVHRYVAAVSVVGLGVLVVVTVRDGINQVSHAPSAFWLFVLFVVVGEVFPIRVTRLAEIDEITTSTTFTFALMLMFGTAGAVLALAAASAVADLVYRKPLWKTGFNVAQYTLSMTAAGWTYYELGGRHAITTHIGAFVAAAATFFFLNGVLTDVAVGLAQDVPLLGYIARDFVFQAYTAPALMALAPVVVVAADRSLWLIPLLALPIGSVYWGATVALENTRLVGQLHESLAHMTELNKLKDEFVAVVSHELRTPLTSIQGYLKTVLQMPGALGDEQHRSFLEAADRQGDRLRHLIEQLLAVARIESNVEPLRLSAVRLDSLARQLVEELGPRGRGHVFDLRVAPDMRELETDEAKAYQILSNLIENAIKYSPPDTRIVIRVDTSGHGVRVSVEDEGPGIPGEAQDRIFDRFFQVDQSLTRRVGGTGLGLYICRRMAEIIGARVWLERSTREGSVFSLEIPAAPPERARDSPQVGTPELGDRARSRRESPVCTT